MTDKDATLVAHAFAKTIAKIADFAADLAETIHKDLGIEYVPAAARKAVKRKPTRQAIDPNAPKKPKSAYLLFSDFCRDEAKKNGQSQPTVTVIAELWQSLKEDEKSKYSEEAEAAKEVYSKLVEKFKGAHSGQIESDVEADDDVAPPS